jgi:hypothetical protein
MTNPAVSVHHIATVNRLLEGAAPQRILRWAVAEFCPHLTMATTFGQRGVA